MITVQVTYKVAPAFIEQNKSNISAFLDEFKRMQTSNFLYHVYVKEDAVTFVHVAMYENIEIQEKVLAIPSFLKFQQERDDIGLVSVPIIETLQHLGSSLGLIK